MKARAGDSTSKGGGDGVAFDESRARWLRRELIAHEASSSKRPKDSARASKLVAAKYARMAENAFAFFRGTAWLRPSEPSAFKTTASSQIALTGDPHPENVGTVAGTDGTLALAFNDFDRAGYGSFVDDVRRLALSMWITSEVADLKRKQRATIASAAVDGYLAEVKAMSSSQGGAPVSPVDGLFGGRFQKILNAPDSDETALGVPASSADTTLARAVIRKYLAGDHPASWLADVHAGGRASSGALKRLFAIKRVLRRNAGIASYTVLRLRVVLEGPTSDDGDDWTIEIKESLAPSAELVVAIQSQFNAPPFDDPLLGWASVDGREYRVRRVSPALRRISVERIAKEIRKGRSDKDDLSSLGLALGRMLARGHCTALDKKGRPGLSAIASAITSSKRFRDDVVGYAERVAAANNADFRLFRQLLNRNGGLASEAEASIGKAR